MTDPTDPDDDLPTQHAFVWKVEHSVAVALFLLALLGVILLNTVI